MKFVRYNDFWYKYDVSTPLNSATLENINNLGRTTGIDISKSQIVEANDVCDLDWYGTKIYDNNYLTGWLAPNGNFYGFDFKHHKEQAKFVHKFSEQQIEDKGFIKITYEDRLCQNLVAMLYCHYNKKIAITPEQYKFLKHYPIKNIDDVYFWYRESKSLKNSKNCNNKKVNSDDFVK